MHRAALATCTFFSRTAGEIKGGSSRSPAPLGKHLRQTPDSLRQGLTWILVILSQPLLSLLRITFQKQFGKGAPGPRAAWALVLVNKKNKPSGNDIPLNKIKRYLKKALLLVDLSLHTQLY